MGALRALWGFFFDDLRLAWSLVLTVALAAVATQLQQPLWVGGILWLGVLAVLAASVLHDLGTKLRGQLPR